MAFLLRCLSFTNFCCCILLFLRFNRHDVGTQPCDPICRQAKKSRRCRAISNFHPSQPPRPFFNNLLLSTVTAGTTKPTESQQSYPNQAPRYTNKLPRPTANSIDCARGSSIAQGFNRPNPTDAHVEPTHHRNSTVKTGERVDYRPSGTKNSHLPGTESRSQL